MGFLATAFEHERRDETHCYEKVTDRQGIHGHRIVMHMAENNGAHIGAHLRDGMMDTQMKLGLNLPKLRLHLVRIVCGSTVNLPLRVLAQL